MDVARDGRGHSNDRREFPRGDSPAGESVALAVQVGTFPPGRFFPVGGSL